MSLVFVRSIQRRGGLYPIQHVNKIHSIHASLFHTGFSIFFHIHPSPLIDGWVWVFAMIYNIHVNSQSHTRYYFKSFNVKKTHSHCIEGFRKRTKSHCTLFIDVLEKMFKQLIIVLCIYDRLYLFALKIVRWVELRFNSNIQCTFIRLISKKCSIFQLFTDCSMCQWCTKCCHCHFLFSISIVCFSLFFKTIWSWNKEIPKKV